MLNDFYNVTTKAAMELQSFGETTFELNNSSTLGFVGTAVQDTRALLVGLQNILAIHLGKPYLKLNLRSPDSIDAPNDFLSVMKSVHRFFFISLQTSLEAAAQRICENRQIHNVTGERAFRRALSGLQKTKRDEWRLFYEGLKILRNECAHVSLSDLHPGSLKKLRAAGFSSLLSDGKISINCQKYLPIAKRATECVQALQESVNFRTKSMLLRGPSQGLN